MRLLSAEDKVLLTKAFTAILEGNNYSVDAVYDGMEARAYVPAELAAICCEFIRAANLALDCGGPGFSLQIPVQQKTKI